MYNPVCNPLRLRTIVQFAAVSLVVGLGIAVLEWAFIPEMTAKWFFTDWILSMLYADVIGASLWLTMPALWASSLSWGPVQRWLGRLGLVVAASVLGCLIVGLVPLAVFRGSYHYWQSFKSALILSLVVGTVFTLVTGMYEQLRERVRVTERELKTKELERERALKLATEARLASLESRIHPHFLFNAINSVSALIQDDPVRAERLLTQMAELLRFSLDSGHGGLVPLASELKIVRDYLDIEQARFDKRLQFSIDVPEALTNAFVPPLAVQTLVENSIKYAVGARRQGATVHIQAARQNGALTLAVSDDGPGFAHAEMPSGHGLSNLQDRLAALFGDAGNLEISSKPGQTRVAAVLPFRTA